MGSCGFQLKVELVSAKTMYFAGGLERSNVVTLRQTCFEVLLHLSKIETEFFFRSFDDSLVCLFATDSELVVVVSTCDAMG